MGYPNNFSSDKWKVTFSNVPLLSGEEKIDMRLIDGYVKTVTLPDLTAEYVNSDFLGSVIRHPISRENNDIGQVGIDMMLSEDMLNYYYFYNWIQQLRYGDFDEDKLRECTVKRIIIQMLDNQNRAKNEFIFTNCLLTNVGSLNLTMGTSEEVTFPLILTHEQIQFNKIED